MNKLACSTFIVICLFFSGCENHVIVTNSTILKDDENIVSTSMNEKDEIEIPLIKSSVDFNQNGIDDYTDILIGARKDIQNEPKYDGSSYADGGYPPDNIGVCTDVVWRAFKNAGYSLKDMVDNDISENLSDYTLITEPEPNIDFRRVQNLIVYFNKYGQSKTLDINDIKEWNPGDIVIYKNPDHIAIVSDIRNKKGISFIVHNAGNPCEEDRINFSEIIGHYRFDASKIDESKLVKFN